MKILWGKPLITVTVVDSTGASSRLTIPTPVADSTTLETERGEKHEAEIEGGGNEAVRFDKGKFTLQFAVRFAKERLMPFSDVSHDGNVSGTYKLVVSDPTDPDAPAMTMNEAIISYEDNLDADDGARRIFYCDSMVPSNGGDQVVWSDGAGVVVPVSSLTFNKYANTQVVAINADTFSVANTGEFITATKEGTDVVVAVTANSGAARTGTVTVTVDGTAYVINVSQEAGN